MPTSTTEQHLRTVLDELQRRSDILTEQIAVLDMDIGRETEEFRKQPLKQRRADLEAERGRVWAAMKNLEPQLSEDQRPVDYSGKAPPFRLPKAIRVLIGIAIAAGVMIVVWLAYRGLIDLIDAERETAKYTATARARLAEIAQSATPSDVASFRLSPSPITASTTSATSIPTPILTGPAISPTHTSTSAPSYTPTIVLSATPAITGTTESRTGSLKVVAKTKSGAQPKGQVDIRVKNAAGQQMSTTEKLPVGTYKIELEYRMEPDPARQSCSPFGMPVRVPAGPWGAMTTIYTRSCSSIYNTVYRTEATFAIGDGQVVQKEIALPFDEGALKVAVRTRAGTIPKRQSQIEITTDGWNTTLVRRSVESNQYEPLMLPDNQAYQVKAIYGTGVKPVEATSSKIRVSPDRATELTVTLPTYEEGTLTVLVRTGSGRILPTEAKVVVSAANDQGNQVTVVEGATKDEFSALLLAGTYTVTAQYQEQASQRGNIRLGESGATETIVFPDSGILSVVLRTESGRVLDKEADVQIFRAQAKDALFSATSSDVYQVEVLPGEYRVEVSYKIGQTQERRTQDVVVKSKQGSEVHLELPDLSKLVVSPRTKTGRLVNHAGSIEVYDAIGRKVDSTQLQPQADYSQLLKAGNYSVVYNYGLAGVKPQSGQVEVKVGQSAETSLALPFDEGQLNVSVVPQGEFTLSGAAKIAIFDSVGRGIDSIEQNQYSSWLPVGKYILLGNQMGALE